MTDEDRRPDDREERWRPSERWQPPSRDRESTEPTRDTTADPPRSTPAEPAIPAVPKPGAGDDLPAVPPPGTTPSWMSPPKAPDPFTPASETPPAPTRTEQFTFPRPPAAAPPTPTPQASPAAPPAAPVAASPAPSAPSVTRPWSAPRESTPPPSPASATPAQTPTWSPPSSTPPSTPAIPAPGSATPAPATPAIPAPGTTPRPWETRHVPPAPKPTPAPAESTVIRNEESRRPIGEVRKLRRGRLAIRKLDPISVWRFSLIFYFCTMLVMLLAGGLIYTALRAVGVVANIEQLVAELIRSDFKIAGFRMFFLGLIAGSIWAAIMSVVTTFAAFLYNLIADVVGGVEMIVVERDQ